MELEELMRMFPGLTIKELNNKKALNRKLISAGIKNIIENKEFTYETNNKQNRADKTFGTAITR